MEGTESTKALRWNLVLNVQRVERPAWVGYDEQRESVGNDLAK